MAEDDTAKRRFQHELLESVKWNEDLAEDYLERALDALQETFEGEPGGRSAARRMQQSRQSMLYSALAAEAYANRFLDEHFAGESLHALDRLATPDKYVFGPQLVFGEALFDRGRDPLQRIVKLFKLRNALVHPKPRLLPHEVDRSSATSWAGPRFKDYNPVEACEHLLAVATAASQLDDALAAAAGEVIPRTLDELAEAVAGGRPVSSRRSLHAGVVSLAVPLRRRARVGHGLAQPTKAELAETSGAVMRLLQKLLAEHESPADE